MTPSIKQRVLLASLNISVWTARAFDNAATQTVESKFSLYDSGRFNKKLMPSNPIEYKNLTSKANAIRTAFYAHTLDYQTMGVRLMPVDIYMEWVNKMRGEALEFERLQEQFFSVYPDIKVQANQLLGPLYIEENYPSIEQLREKFGIKFSVLPFPDAEHLGVDLPEFELKTLKQEISENMQSAIDFAYSDLSKRLYEATLHLAQRASSDGILHSSAINNLREIIGILPKLNFTNDEKLQQLADMASRELTVYDAEALRSTPAIRRDVAAKAVDIANTMSDYFSIPFDSNLLFEVDDAESNLAKTEKSNVQQLDLLAF